ncbi:hypothetical protein J2Z40_003078 [Cytobacillus eiseniae]|uniref:DUF3899 domain-containing protein n=2 Tax=Cytobacillus eiseniae TaxID=762947 RepID=A0ABS4RJM9_9BACI|nr:hypothetical protein [Cytobacillus eiseniae]
MIGGILVVLKGGLFDGILYSFKQFYKRTSKLEEYVTEQTERIHDPTHKTGLKDLYVYPLIISGAMLFIFTLFAAVI